jgi:hypothetical protein
MSSISSSRDGSAAPRAWAMCAKKPASGLAFPITPEA